MPGNLEHALALARGGWPVFPIWHVHDGVCACGNPARGQIGKHPRTWHGHNDATLDEDQIKTWWCAPDAAPAPVGFEWECDPDSNIGIAIPDGIVIVDIDGRNGGFETAAALDEKYGDAFLPDTARILSGSGDGSEHYYYHAPTGTQYPKTLNEHGGPGIDIKQLGGYVLAPPSVHKSGGCYAYADASGLANIADAPAWLLALGTPRKARVKRTLDRSKHNDALSAETLADGDAIIELLEPHYVEGSKHAISRSFGGYCKKQGRSSALVEYVVSQLPSTDPEMRVEAALTYYGYDNPTGWAELKEHLPEDAAQALEARVKGRRRNAGLKLSERRLQASEPPELREVATGGNPLDALSPADDPDAEVPPLDYVCEKFGIAEGKVTVIGGYAGSGKSPLALLLAACVASGKPFLEGATSKRPVVFNMYEGERLTRIRRQRICRALRVPFGGTTQLDLRRVYQGLDATTLSILRDAALWYRDANNGKGVLFMHDTYTSAMRGIDQNSAEYADALWALGDMGDETGCINVVLAHFKKSKDGETDIQMLSGHNTIGAAVQTVLGLLPSKAKPEEVTIYPSRVPETPFKPQTIVWEDESDPELADGAGVAARLRGHQWGLKCVLASAPAKEADPKEEIARDVLKLLQGKPYGLGTGEILAAVSARDIVVRGVLKSLASAGVLKTLKQGNSVNYVKA